MGMPQLYIAARVGGGMPSSSEGFKWLVATVLISWRC